MICSSENPLPPILPSFALWRGFLGCLRMKPLFSIIFCGIILAAGLCASADGADVDFRTDVMAVLSKAGCNAGTCHGNAMGKGGFKLSLRGQDPDLDWLALTRDQGGRRVNMIEPVQSLTLMKALGAIAHEGGQRFDLAAPEYDILMRWIRSGARDTGAARKVVKLDVTPVEQVLIEPASEVRLKAVATFSDGTVRDVTRLAVFDPNNLGVKVTVDGNVTREHFGETTVLVRFLGQQVPVRLAFAPERADFVWSDPAAANFVDEHVFKKLRTLRMNPAGLCDDATFLRRAYLDLLGIVPPPDAVRVFSTDSAPDKRAKLADSLMQRGEFATFWALKWADLLKIEERQLDTKGMEVFHGWIRKAVAENMPLDKFAAELIAARGSTYANPPANWWRANRDPVTRAENTARIFLGTQLNCAQCHNHPFERWTQDDYYDWTSVFSRVDYKIVENKKRDKSDKNEFKGEQMVMMKPGKASVPNARTGTGANARFLGVTAALKPTEDHDELQSLAEWLPHSPMFARTQANRIWVQLLGRGIVDPVDDFRASNPPTHPDLLDALVKEFTTHGYDLRHLIRTIMASRTYQLASDGGDADDEANYSHALIRRLGAEQILDSMSTALAAPLSFPEWPGATRLAELPEGRKHYHPITSDLDRFALAFGKPPRLIASDCERTNEPTVAQAFQLLSGPVINELLTRKDNRIGSLLATTKPDAEIVSELYLAALSREPSAAELSRAKSHLASEKDKRRALEDLEWALLNAKEFLFRH